MTDRSDRGEIHLGDLARALASLHWENDEQARAIAASLGFGLHAAPKPGPPTEIYDRQRYRRQATAQSKPPPECPVFVPRDREAPLTLPENALSSFLQPIAERAPAAPEESEWLNDPDELYSDEEESAVSRQPLFLEQTNRHLLSAALASLRVGQEIEIHSLIAAVCRREVVAKVPCRPDSTLEFGCQLLLDYSATMVPFWEDLNGLIGQVADVVGTGSTRVFSFDTRPTDAFTWTADGRREPWQPEGRPVLAATDFGVQGGSARAEPDPAWQELTGRCSGDGIPLVILIPWPEEYWPRDIGGSPELVHWSPGTTAGMIRRKIGAGHRLN